MSLGSKIVLGSSVVFAATTIIYVHRKQKIDRENLHEGVIKDLQRQAMKRTQNIKALQDQIELTKVLEAQRQEDLKNKNKDS